MHPFLKEEPTDTRMFRCPSCREIVTVGNATCRYCGSTIDEETARGLNLDFQKVTDAVAGANTFKQSIWLAVLLAALSPTYFLLLGGKDQRLFFVSAAPIAALAYGISWHRKYSRLDTSDKDYPDAVRDMRRTIVVWLVALVIHVGTLWYALSSGFFSSRG